MSNVIVFPRGQLTELDRARLEGAGVVAVEADDPSTVVTVIPTAAIKGDAILRAAMYAVKSSTVAPEIFVKQLFALMESQP